MNTSLQKKLGQYKADFRLVPNELTIELHTPSVDFILKTTIANSKLPSSFNNIFDNVDDLFAFVRDATTNMIEIVGHSLLLRVQCLKIREVSIELNKVEMSKDDLMDRKINKMEKRSLDLEAYICNDMQKQIRSVEESCKKSIKLLADQVKRLNQKVTTLTQKTQTLQQGRKPPQALSQMQSHTFSRAPSQLPYQTQTPSQVPNFFDRLLAQSKQNTSIESKTALNPIEQKVAQLKSTNNITQVQNKTVQGTPDKTKALDFSFDIDPSNIFLQYYSITNNTISKTKNNQEIVMVYASNPIPSTGRHSVKFRINKITECLIWIGLIAESKKTEQYIGQESSAIQFSLGGTQIIMEGRKFTTNTGQIKSGSVIAMEVQVSSRKLRFYRNGRENAMLKITLPESMGGVKLFPYVQMIHIGDSVTFI